MMAGEDATRDAWEAEAHRMGTEAGTAAGSWVIDGNTSAAAARAILAAFEGCEYDWPAGPLSGEYADGLTPRDLYETVTGRDAHADATFAGDSYDWLSSDLCDAFEEGYAEGFEAEAVRAARYVLGHDVFGHETGGAS